MSSGAAGQHVRKCCAVCGIRRDRAKGRWLCADNFQHLVNPQHSSQQQICQACYKAATMFSTTASAACTVWKPWSRLGWIEQYDTGHYGDGIRATCDIIMSPSTVVAAHLEGMQLSAEQFASMEDPSYVMDTSANEGEHVYVDLKTSWVGKINHAPCDLCNMEFFGPVLRQVKDIKAGEPLLVEYSRSYWFHRCFGGLEESEAVARFVDCDEKVVYLSKLALEAFDDLYREVTDWSDYMAADGYAIDTMRRMYNEKVTGKRLVLKKLRSTQS